MAKELVVRDTLTDEMILVGKKITEKLDDTGIKPNAAFWFFPVDGDVWKLIFASPLVRTEGPRKMYMKVHEAIADLPEDLPALALKDITVVNDRDQLVSLLKKEIKTGSDLSDIRLSRSAINGTYIEDALIYRLN